MQFVMTITTLVYFTIRKKTRSKQPHEPQATNSEITILRVILGTSICSPVVINDQLTVDASVKNIHGGNIS